MEVKKLDWILESSENFESLKGMVLLFDKNSEYYSFSGFVTAALLDYEEENNEKITILAIDTKHLNGWLTFRKTREDLRKMLSNCIEFVGENEEKSFVLGK